MKRPPRRRVFLGCEGESERSYGSLLRRLLEAQRQDVHLDAVLLGSGGGDPLALVERAQRLIKDARRKRETYEIHAILLDADKLGEVPNRDAPLYKIAESLNLRLIWQTPCHEALLLRHLAGCRSLQPATTKLAEMELKRHWPGYYKGMSAIRLAERIGTGEVQQARQVEEALAGFLYDIGFV